MFIFNPPKVYVIPPVTRYAENGGVSIARAQLLFGGSTPSVPFPSSLEGSNAPSCTASLNSLIVPSIFAASSPIVPARSPMLDALTTDALPYRSSSNDSAFASKI